MSRCWARVERQAPECREETTMSNEQATPETNGVTVELLATVDLGPEIEGMAGRQLRMRMVTIDPGMVRAWAGPRIGTPSTGSRTKEQLRPWRSQSTSSAKSRFGPDMYQAS
jgi:hypothetical protein